jgi:hypothetical protein
MQNAAAYQKQQEKTDSSYKWHLQVGAKEKNQHSSL